MLPDMRAFMVLLMHRYQGYRKGVCGGVKVLFSACTRTYIRDVRKGSTDKGKGKRKGVGVCHDEQPHLGANDPPPSEIQMPRRIGRQWSQHPSSRSGCVYVMY